MRNSRDCRTVVTGRDSIFGTEIALGEATNEKSPNICIYLDQCQASSPINGLNGHLSFSCCGPEPRWFFRDTALPARDTQ